ncbi:MULTISPECIES: O-antigen ligase [unclassified Rhodococcus (in: high G+C Gram-positive bacteria)]|uniref:O-antigen ligase family protein n=1 Tax=unclassified Rhodococcus (in: high G+C Gram-positive bacteria) TaxID=192944 RepID=UPI00163B590F|nr:MULTISPECIES: O-antigen ligase family protein [unclassified Rhodococcus (in: high G+C Gram-positive bacteria)]MBC2642973.1 O-antigen ligase family protein [Rhodococcus sp. 3A]MBC2892285.1 O-antigen ligase family protein [Rhodococcus sp. 4CII]
MSSTPHLADPTNVSSTGGSVSRWMPGVAFPVAVLVVFAAAVKVPTHFGVLLLLGAVGSALVFAGLRDPVVAVLLLLVTTFLRVATPSILPVDPFVLAYLGVVGAWAIWIARGADRAPRLGAIECAMVLYVTWNMISMFSSHPYGSVIPLSGAELSVPRFVLTGAIIPFTVFVVGRATFDRVSAVRLLLWTILTLGAYSAAVSILQFHGPTALVWPRYIVESPSWEGRAVGIFDQPVVNGVVLILAFIVALLLAATRSEPRWSRILATAIAVASAYGVYLTHTRVVWLAFAVVVLIGAVSARGFRTGFVTTGAVAAAAVTVKWSAFTSSDRSAGGVGSPDELQDRLNTAKTAIWAIQEKPLAGWGIGRFTAMNTYHHQRWAPDVPWIRGFGIASHFNELGIAAELGLIGLTLWLAVLFLLARGLFHSYRVLPADGLCGRRLALVAIMAFIVLVISGLTVDLRFFDFPNAVVMLLVGITIGWADRSTEGHVTSDAQGCRSVAIPTRERT